MYRLIAILFISVIITGCNSIPSFYDDNESKAAVDIQYSVSTLDCRRPHIPQINNLKAKVDWLKLYSTGKKSNDVLAMVSSMSETVDGFQVKGETSLVFFSIKKTLLTKQSSNIIDAIMRRF